MRRRKKNPAQWDGKSGKLPPPLNKKKESKRISFVIPKPHECRDYCEDPFSSTDNVVGRIFPDRPRLYTPEQIYNAKSQYARFERALELFPAKIEESSQETVYWYPSCDAPDGFWHVRFTAGATFVRAHQILNIVCPAPYQLKGIESDGDSFVWEQISGNRTVTVTPPDALNPILFLENYCNGNGCDDGSSLPIVLKVSVAGQPELYDFLTIYNTPTSNMYFGSYGAQQSDTPCLKVDTVTPAPIYVYHSYQLFPGDPLSLSLTWDAPTCDQEYLIGYVWQQNVNGHYINIEPFTLDQDRLFEADFDTYYRVVAVYNYYNANVVYSPSRSVFYIYNHERKIVLNDDTYRTGSYGSALISIEAVTLQAIELIEEDIATDISYGAAILDIQLVMLDNIALEIIDEEPDITYGSTLTPNITSLNLGGILIK